MKVARVPQTQEDIHAALAPVRGQICKAFQTGQGDADRPADLIASIEDGRQELWAVHDESGVRAVCALAVNQFSRCRKLFVSVLAGAGITAWSDELEGALKSYRDATGAQCIEASCRPGLARYLKRRGWTVKAIIMEAPQ